MQQTNKEFFKDYKKEFASVCKEKKLNNFKQFNTIINLYTGYIGKKILKGYSFNLGRLGNFKLVLKKVRSSKPLILSGETSRKRKETGDSSIVVYRENEDYFQIYWSNKIFYPAIKFKLSWNVERAIPDNDQILRLKATRKDSVNLNLEEKNEFYNRLSKK